MISYSSNYNSDADPDGIAQLPAVYLSKGPSDTPDGDTVLADDLSGTDRMSDEIKIAQTGLNHMIFNVKNGGVAGYVCFHNTNKHNYQIRDFRVTGNEAGISIGGFEGGYYDVPSNCFPVGDLEIQAGLPQFATTTKKVVGYIENDEDSYCKIIVRRLIERLKK